MHYLLRFIKIKIECLKKIGFESLSIEVEIILNIHGPVYDSIRIGA